MKCCVLMLVGATKFLMHTSIGFNNAHDNCLGTMRSLLRCMHTTLYITHKILKRCVGPKREHTNGVYLTKERNKTKEECVLA